MLTTYFQYSTKFSPLCDFFYTPALSSLLHERTTHTLPWLPMSDHLLFPTDTALTLQLLGMDVAPDHGRQAALAESLRQSGPQLHHVDGVLVGIDSGVPSSVALEVVDGQYARHALALVRAHVSPHDTALCVGAQMGVVATALAQQTGRSVVCLDEEAAHEPRVQLTAELNNVDVRFVVLGPRAAATSAPALGAAPVPAFCASQEVSTVYLDMRPQALDEHLASITLPTSVRKVFISLDPYGAPGALYAQVLRKLVEQGFLPWDAHGPVLYFERQR